MAIAFKSYCVYRMHIRCLNYDLNCETMYPDCIQDGHLWVCKPRCGQWKEFPHSTVVATDAVVIVSASIGFIVANTLLILSCIRYRKV